MFLIVTYSFLLIAGMSVSQWVDVGPAKDALSTLTIICLAYIMLEVGLEFHLDKEKQRHYVWDFCVATTAAVFPWLFCAIYLLFFFQLEWKQAFLIGLSAAPTSAGGLFAMLSAAGLSTTWLFRKARVLAIFDDLATILLMIPLQVAFIGFKLELVFVVVIIFCLLGVAYKWLHRLSWPIGKEWLFFYAMGMVSTLTLFERTTHIHLHVLFPAFTFGCLLNNHHQHQGSSILKISLAFDQCVKGMFMFLVGCSLPKIEIGNVHPGVIILHVLALTILFNLGKCFCSLCYRNEASLKSRLALSVAMFPRGEVGAGVLLIAISYGFGGIAASLGVLSLALNLLLTGVFIAVVKVLIKQDEMIPKKKT